MLDKSPSPSGQRGSNVSELPARLPNPLSPFLAATASNLRLQFSSGTPLGVGGGGAVFRCVHKATGMRVALKEIRVTQFRPAELISDVDHPNIVRVLGSFPDEQCNQCIVQEFCALGDVSKPLADGHAAKYPTKLVTYIAASVSEALAFIHSLNHVHRDIKPENIFVTEAGQVKLGDFGVSKRLAEADRYTDTMAGTPHYLGPEVLRQGGVTLVSDVWALGISIIELATGKLPHADLKPFHVITKVAEDEPPTLECDSSDLVRVTAAMLKREPADRITTADLVRSSYLCGKSKDAKQARKLVRFLTKGTRKKRSKEHDADAGWSFESECTAAKAEVLLEGDEPGSFLVRPAFSAENALSVSFVASDGSVQHAHVHVDPAGRGFFLDDSVPLPQRVYYATMEEVAQVTGLGSSTAGSRHAAPRPRPGSTYQPLPVAQFPVDDAHYVSMSVSSREVAEHRLTHNGRQPGAWLLRPTSAGGPDTVCLSGLDHGGNVYHSLIDRAPGGFTIQSDDLSGEVFATVPILLQALASKSLIDANAYCGD
jgi:serine/threonine protein kinase